MRNIDLNCDLGEGNSYDNLAYPFISSGNIACGYHAGDLACIEEAINRCINHKIAIGAHPGFADKENFGNKDVTLSSHRLQDLIMHQILTVRFISLQHGFPLNHIKLHGAMHRMSLTNHDFAAAVAKAVYRVDPTIIVYAPQKSAMLKEASSLQLSICHEAFADRIYTEDGTPIADNEPGAFHTSMESCLQQAIQILKTNTVTTYNGVTVPIIADTISLANQTNVQKDFMVALHKHLKENKIAVKSFHL